MIVAEKSFTVTDEVLALGVSGDFFVMHGLNNTQTHSELQEYKRALCARLVDIYNGVSLESRLAIGAHEYRYFLYRSG